MKIAFDTKLKRPGCAILQAALGGSDAIANQFPSETWLIDITPDLRVYPVTEKQLEMLVQMAIDSCAGSRPLS